MLAVLSFLLVWPCAVQILSRAMVVPLPRTTLRSRTKAPTRWSTLRLRGLRHTANVEPEVSIAVTGGGSGTGIASLINGTVDIANASRAMKESEIEAAQANGFDPQEYVVAIDALAVIVNPRESRRVN